jgi:hypothetical protein
MMLGEEFYVITDSGQTGPYRTLSQAWSALLNTSGCIVCHNLGRRRTRVGGFRPLPYRAARA